MKTNSKSFLLFFVVILICGGLFYSLLLQIKPYYNYNGESNDKQQDNKIVLQGGTDAQLEIDSVSNLEPICGEVLDFHVIAKAEEAKDCSAIPVRLYVDLDLNNDGTAFDDAMGELRFIRYGAGYISFTIPCDSNYQPSLRMFTVKVEEEGSLFHGSDDIQVEIIETPQISIEDPNDYDVFGSSAPAIDVSFSAKGIQSKMYKVHNHSISGIYEPWTGEISTDQWNAVGNGSISVTFELKDTSKHTIYKTLELYKDIKAPIVDLGWIEEGNEYRDESPRYCLLVQEGNLKEAWYTLNGGNKVSLGKIPSKDWVEGNISQSEWEKLPNGNVEIRFYASDTMGNQASLLITVIKDGTITGSVNGTDGTDGTNNGTGDLNFPEIPGFELEIIIGNIFILTLVLIRRIKRLGEY